VIDDLIGNKSTTDGSSLPLCCSKISATGQPLPLIPGENFFKLGQEMQALAFMLCANIALSLLAASFAPFLVRWAAAAARCVGIEET
jgi:hypothetical protein